MCHLQQLSAASHLPLLLVHKDSSQHTHEHAISRWSLCLLQRKCWTYTWCQASQPLIWILGGPEKQTQDSSPLWELPSHPSKLPSGQFRSADSHLPKGRTWEGKSHLDLFILHVYGLPWTAIELLDLWGKNLFKFPFSNSSNPSLLLGLSKFPWLILQLGYFSLST